jgi:hypothetical protein
VAHKVGCSIDGGFVGGCVEVDHTSQVELEVGVDGDLCARALLVGGGEVFREARERDG